MVLTNCIENSSRFAEWEYHAVRRERALKIGYAIVHGPFGTTLQNIENKEFVKGIDTRTDAYKYLSKKIKENPSLLKRINNG